MFSFHKPKIYRSNLGCCICKAKSSSSRFTDSTKYENEFERCFRIQEKRSGEICNACVLLVKRWKKLSPEGKLTKHWHHVVDARAGPGTKLTGNRRLTSNSASHHHGCQSDGTGSSNRVHNNSGKNKSDVLPLSSSQTNNHQSGTTSSTTKTTRVSSFIKARAIDTNVSTFTFGEPPRRSYMTGEPAYSSIPSSISSSYISKPQSSLNSQAFESVIKRFRQRQQQQQLNAKRREQIRQLRSQRQSSLTNSDDATSKKGSPSRRSIENNTNSAAAVATIDHQQQQQDFGDKPAIKRFKRSSESMATFGSDILKVATLLDTSIWRKEKVCCGYIFRGLYNEIAILPKLLKPCQCRGKFNNNAEELSNSEIDQQQQDREHQQEEEDSNDTNHLLKRQTESPPPRATKSGSISSCDSHTSGTGSMEQPLDEIHSMKRAALVVNADKSQIQRTNSRKAAINKRKLIDNDNFSSSSGASMSSSIIGKNFVRSPSSSSSSRLMLALHDDDDGLILDEEDTSQSSNDASSSSVESLADKTNIAIG